MLINTPENTRMKTKDTPCTMYLQFFIRPDKDGNDRLLLITNMRSNDVFFGVPYDVSFFSMLQEYTLIYLKSMYPDLKLGPYTHRIGSLHMYKKDMDVMIKILNSKEQDDGLVYVPKMEQTTLNQMDLFIKSETEGKRDNRITDPFLNCALNYILGAVK